MATPQKLGVIPPSHTVPPSVEFSGDPRWQLVERILQTGPFQKSVYLPSLLSYLAEHCIRRPNDTLTERQIGIAVFGKPAGYSPAEDSAVRVHVRQLRLRLHEYFAREGREETLLVDIPKGSYALEFHCAESGLKSLSDSSPSLPVMPEKTNKIAFRDVLSGIAIFLALICGFGWYHSATTGANAEVPWPLNAVMRKNQETKIVVADSNSMLRLLGQKELSLEQYLQPGFFEGIIPAHLDDNMSRLVNYISDSQLTSFSDALAAATLIRLAGSHADHISICSARDLNRRDLEQGNYVFIGGPTSNPWVSLYKDKLNFETVEDNVGGRMYFLNKVPKPGEQPIYEGLKHTGSAGEDYATISLLPTGSGQGNVLILQGLRQEGTEALGVLLSDAATRSELRRFISTHEGVRNATYFEALIRTRAVAGAPVSISVVAARSIP